MRRHQRASCARWPDSNRSHRAVRTQTWPTRRNRVKVVHVVSVRSFRSFRSSSSTCSVIQGGRPRSLIPTAARDLAYPEPHHMEPFEVGAQSSNGHATIGSTKWAQSLPDIRIAITAVVAVYQYRTSNSVRPHCLGHLPNSETRAFVALDGT